MKIFLMTQYFYPEPGAPTNRLLPFARALANSSNEVTVICEFPCYPSGVLSKEHKFKLCKKVKFENFTIIHTFVVSTKRSGLMSRLVNYFSFMISSFVVGLFLRKPDIIIASSPPLFVAPSAILLSIFKRAPLVADIRDPWPEDAISLGLLNNRLAIWGGRITAKMLYRRALFITTISNGLREILRKLAGDKDIFVIYNGSSVPDIYRDLPIKNPTSSRNNFLICYSGVLGLSQPIEDIIMTAESTKDDKSFEYLIIGDGVMRANHQKLAEKLNLNNIRFIGGVSFLESIELMRTSDVAIVSLVINEVFLSAIPSKFFDCMALGLPVILGVNGEARRILEENKTGLYYHSGNWQDLKEKIVYLKNNIDTAKAFGENGRRLVYNNFRRSILSDGFAKLIEQKIVTAGKLS